MKKLILSSILVLVFASFPVQAQTTYFDVDFGSPPHTVGNAPVTGLGINTPSEVNYGNPTVQNSFSSLTNQPLVFNTQGNPGPYHYDQIKFNVNQGSDNYLVSFDLATSNFVGTSSTNAFAISLDAPSFQSIIFQPNGDIVREQARYQLPTVSETIGSFLDDTLIHMDIAVDLIAKEWSIYTNNASSPLYSGEFYQTTPPNLYDVVSVRYAFGLSALGPASTTFDSVGLDNINISDASSIVHSPEPVSSALFIIGGLVLGTRRFIKKRKTV